MQVDLVTIPTNGISELSDVMYLCWRREFIFIKESQNYLLKRDYLLEKIAAMEEKFELYSNGALSGEEFDSMIDLRGEYVNQLFAPLYGANENPETYEERIESLATIGEDLGWDMALEEVNKRFPNRLTISSEKRGRHWKRALYFEILKDYADVLQRILLKRYQGARIDKPTPWLGVSNLDFETDADLLKALSVVMSTPSDESIFKAYQEVMDDQLHKYYPLFNAVNSETNYLLLGSVKALERSLSIGRSKRRR